MKSETKNRYGSSFSERKEKYIDYDGAFCPHCESNDVWAIDMGGEFQFAWKEVLCETCQKTWKEVFSLSDIEEINDDD